MMGIGGVEILILLIISLFFMAIPVASLVLIFLIFEKLKRIEEALNRSEQG